MSVRRLGLGSILLLTALCGAVSAQEVTLRANAARMEERILRLAEFGKDPRGGVSRLAFSEADLQGRAYIISLMRQAGLTVRVDPAGNIIGRREGREPHLPPIVFGSHIDSVPNGGRYDGVVGVIGAIECIEVLNAHGVMTRHPLEVIVFAAEEGGLFGSRALIGALTPEALAVVTNSGKTVRDGIRAIGGDPDRLAEAVRRPGEVKAFLELHVEQGGVLEAEGAQIGVVEGIVGIRRWDVEVEGFANHAGTTPMNQRRDALVAAAELILAVNRVVTSVPGRQVGTVGRIVAEPGAVNVIPGRVRMSLELRDLSAEKIEQLFERIRDEARAIENRRSVTITFTPIDATAIPAPTDARVRQLIAETARELGLRAIFMPSGAGHDAQNMARIAPTGMIFVPSVGGISHSPQEYTRPEDLANGATVLLHTILKIDRGALP
ncbi:MAG: Zn-dependent hydrolase [Blastocatellia bacterium]|nr:Zn-dependent hydrolase [Blastocatellia bacterium]MCS7158264.1 Zn-dependent hydrolase [Blastocatellia bacterium]MCX7753102.1 Zn-dependent hydrolase [Blastocatellia bacterium]MDW8169416.1 Zn-dependent hydrolase [Acidobacteriota bacterium]MDW8255691.1 Zn-dependent hydrolase [Acidobacteriota bacterium]